MEENFELGGQARTCGLIALCNLIEGSVKLPEQPFEDSEKQVLFGVEIIERATFAIQRGLQLSQ